MNTIYKALQVCSVVHKADRTRKLFLVLPKGHTLISSPDFDALISPDLLQAPYGDPARLPTAHPLQKNTILSALLPLRKNATKPWGAFVHDSLINQSIYGPHSLFNKGIPCTVEIRHKCGDPYTLHLDVDHQSRTYSAKTPEWSFEGNFVRFSKAVMEHMYDNGDIPAEWTKIPRRDRLLGIEVSYETNDYFFHYFETCTQFTIPHGDKELVEHVVKALPS